MEGTYYDKRTKKFVARARVEGKRKYLGSFDTQAEAFAKYLNHRASQPITEPFGMSYEYEDVSIQWLKPFRALKAVRRRFQLNKEIDELIEKL